MASTKTVGHTQPKYAAIERVFPCDGSWLAAPWATKAQATFDAFSPSAKREYIEWITDAKSEDTRARRLATAMEWMAEGKHRNWKYM